MSSFAKNSVETWLSDPTSVIWIGGYTADYTFSKDDENHTDILLGNMSGDSNVTTPSFTIPVPNGFLLDQYAIWFWANRQNSTSIFESKYTLSGSKSAHWQPATWLHLMSLKAANFLAVRIVNIATAVVAV